MALAEKQLSQDHLLSPKSASPITLLSSQVLGHRVASLNLAPQSLLGGRVAPKAYRPLGEEASGQNQEGRGRCAVLGSTYSAVKDVGALCTRYPLHRAPSAPADSFPVCDAGVRTWASLAHARPGQSTSLANPRLASRFFRFVIRRVPWAHRCMVSSGGLSTAASTGTSEVPRSMLSPVPFCTLGLGLPT